MDYWLIFSALFPLLSVLLFLVVLRWPARKAMPLCLLGTVILSAMVWSVSNLQIAAAVAEGLVIAATVVWVVFGALLLLNLLENALQATESGGLVSLLALEEGGMAFFSVQDTGKGIPLDVQARLFTPFFTTRAEGTGLGLAIARGVARAHGGDIALQSREGEGTRFTFTLPVLGGSQALEDKHE